ncbi:MAG: LacI family transcriptional regulator [Coprobacillus sp.]|nr:LacI family transcriptional regulator [Coprobacillus sp.]
MTIKDIAKICGVSTSTVSKVINNYPSIPAETREKVLRTIEEYNFYPNSVASQLSTKLSRNIGILGFLSNEESPFGHPLFSKILVAFQNEIIKNGYDLLFVDKSIKGREESYLANCRSRNIGGVLIFGFIIDEMTFDLLKSDIPTIVFDYYGEDTCSVRSNSVKAMEELTDYVIDMGHKNIYLVLGDDTLVANYRLKGYQDSLAKHGLSFNKYLFKTMPYYGTNQAYQITQEIILNHPEVTCIMFPDDYTACAAIKAANALGKKVPEDISITGFDGTDVGYLLPKTLTTYKQDASRIGKVLADHLIALMNGQKVPQVTELEGTLITGETVKNIKLN